MAKILIVDDSRLTRRMIASAIQEDNHEIAQAGDGAEGLEVYRQFNPDCVMSDLLMPVMDGFEFAAELRAIDPGLPIIISTADIQKHSRDRCVEIGVTSILTKPAKGDEIRQAVTDALQKSEVTSS